MYAREELLRHSRTSVPVAALPLDRPRRAVCAAQHSYLRLVQRVIAIVAPVATYDHCNVSVRRQTEVAVSYLHSVTRVQGAAACKLALLLGEIADVHFLQQDARRAVLREMAELGIPLDGSGSGLASTEARFLLSELAELDQSGRLLQHSVSCAIEGPPAASVQAALTPREVYAVAGDADQRSDLRARIRKALLVEEHNNLSEMHIPDAHIHSLRTAASTFGQPPHNTQEAATSIPVVHPYVHPHVLNDPYVSPLITPLIRRPTEAEIPKRVPLTFPSLGSIQSGALELEQPLPTAATVEGRDPLRVTPLRHLELAFVGDEPCGSVVGSEVSGHHGASSNNLPSVGAVSEGSQQHFIPLSAVGESLAKESAASMARPEVEEPAAARPEVEELAERPEVEELAERPEVEEPAERPEVEEPIPTDEPVIEAVQPTPDSETEAVQRVSVGDVGIDHQEREANKRPSPKKYPTHEQSVEKDTVQPSSTDPHEVGESHVETDVPKEQQVAGDPGEVDSPQQLTFAQRLTHYCTALLEEGVWASHIDDGSGREYFSNTETKRVVWNLSKEVAPQFEAEEVARLLDSREWVAAESGGKTYFYHADTKATTWDLRKWVREH